MNYKEKYDKLVEAVKVLQEENPSDEGIQNWVNDNVPELRKSEDEKIRIALINVFATHKDYEMFFGVSVEDIQAWLEKQGTSYTKRDVDDAYVEGMAFAKNELEKQKLAKNK
jgi:TusA-related sulfurtransferase